MSALARSLKIALIQFAAGADKAANLATVKTKVSEAVANGAKLVVLPECFNSPYAVSAFPKYAEKIPEGETTQFLSELAKKSNIFLIGGSIPEIGSDGKIYNTNVSFDTQGTIIAKHRKVHLFDIDVPGKIRFIESETLTGGSKATVFDVEGFGTVGLGICYDIRFPELASIAARKGAFALLYPGAFNTTTGPLHWKLLARARAVDNQVYVITASPSRDLTSSYHAYGHSQVIDPWGETVSEAQEGEEIIYATLEPEKIDSARSGIPVTSQRRFDVYEDVSTHAKVSDK
ncbi:Nit3p [Sugiyamaella lignohabitans]|uniref:Nit3p n=1 Tax=Sugiyamaella lignohabitans TaxID=796027 RepID=A0A167FNI1_9ASCO|nr:Nit3p [Sugiyamaella lignohabitans]ANB15513.1 Nit3p [Sugiyamaella lignohabitans]